MLRVIKAVKVAYFAEFSFFASQSSKSLFFYGPDGSGWVHMKGNGPLSVSEVQERPDMVKYAHRTVSEKPTLKGG